MLVFLISASFAVSSENLGRFDPERDLYLAHFDLRTDVDDVHSVAAVATMLADPRFSDVSYHTVAGAYGFQEGLYVPADELFVEAFGANWSDRHGDPETALREVTDLSRTTLESGGSVWIAEGGQSDFSAELFRELREVLPNFDPRVQFHVVQHSRWNENTTTPADLESLREYANYVKIPDGNRGDNGSPNFRTGEVVEWKEQVKDARLQEIWEMAIATANRFNGVEGRFLNTYVESGGLDFSDVVETAWIFGFDDLEDVHAFFEEFSSEGGVK